MKKQRQAAPARAYLPEETLVKIAFYIPDVADAKAFLGGLTLYSRGGSLQNIFYLIDCGNPTDVWPSLRINKESITNTFLIKSVKFHPNLTVDNMRDTTWIKKHTNLAANIEWIVNDFPITMDLVDSWSGLRITGLSLGYKSEAPSGWKDVLTRLPLLRSLKLDNVIGDLDGVFDFVAKSKTLTGLEICSVSNRASHLVDITSWFRNRQPRDFVVKSTEWCPVDKNVLQNLHEAIFDSPTLDRLLLSGVDLYDFNFSKVSLLMKSLQLEDCCLDGVRLKTFISKLAASSVVHLDLSLDWENCIEELGCLFQILPQTSVKSLKLKDMSIKKADWDTLLLPQSCAIETLTLSAINFPSALAKSLAAVIQNNHTIVELDLCDSDIAIPDLTWLVKGMTHTSRRVPKTCIKWTRHWRAVGNLVYRKAQDLVSEYNGHFEHDNDDYYTFLISQQRSANS
ncbi:unnamed protein product [Aphanomyces euteiches]|uniref:F-box domain-containing protein n=1 Tax=Aphanomyces euteiches TaxID=100861 RepID=A0A6G0XUU1_9STRA|nr:hypothetical protein Ae201684_001292 [Aphanomyces euteiches]KAH9099881.1 hypothetical protein Ae201684P_018889 [Aphanomyces euteiches]